MSQQHADPADISLRIPAQFNLVLATLILVIAVCLLALASRLPTAWLLPVGILFSFVLSTNYALLPEGSHGLIHQDPRLNELIGAVLG